MVFLVGTSLCLPHATSPSPSLQDNGSDLWHLIDILSEKTLLPKTHVRQRLEALWEVLQPRLEEGGTGAAEGKETSLRD